jgi:hypothetical protein
MQEHLGSRVCRSDARQWLHVLSMGLHALAHFEMQVGLV